MFRVHLESTISLLKENKQVEEFQASNIQLLVWDQDQRNKG